MEKNAKISGFWYFFQTYETSLFSTLTGYAKCHHFCHLGAQTDPHSCVQKELRHFTWPVRVLPSSLTGYGKCCHFCRLGTHTDLHSCGQKKQRHSQRSVRVLTSGISQIQKLCQNPEIPRILALFSDLQNSTCTMDRKCWVTLLSLLRYKPCDVPRFFSLQVLCRAVGE